MKANNIDILSELQTGKTNSKEDQTLNSVPLSSFEVREIQWLWKNRIPYGCVTILEGEGGVGKSSIIASIGAAVSSGAALPDDVAKPPGAVLLLAAEDDPAVVLRPRFEANYANLDLVRCYDQTMLLNKQHLESLQKEIIQYSLKLIVIDPIVSFLGQKIDASKATDVRSVMGPLHEMAKKNQCAIVVVRHWNKSSTATASQRGSGSVDFRNAARSVLQVLKEGDEHFLTLDKSNYGVTGQTLTFQIENKVVKWTGSSELSADDILRQQQQNTADAKSELEEAVQFLESELSSGPIQSKKLLSDARDYGISEATLKRARKQLGIIPKKLPGWNGFICYMPHQIPTKIRDEVHEAHVSGSELHDPHDPHPTQMNIGEQL